MEPKNINDALVDENWMISMQDKLNQFERSEVWELVPRPLNKVLLGLDGSLEIKWMKMT